MAFWSVCEEKDLEEHTPDTLQSWFDGYCEWCWWHGYGNCDNCREYYKHLQFICQAHDAKKDKGQE